MMTNAIPTFVLTKVLKVLSRLVCLWFKPEQIQQEAQLVLG